MTRIAYSRLAKCLSRDTEQQTMTLTYVLDLDRSSEGQMSFCSKVIVWKQTHATDRLLCTATKVVGENLPV